MVISASSVPRAVDSSSTRASSLPRRPEEFSSSARINPSSGAVDGGETSRVSSGWLGGRLREDQTGSERIGVTKSSQGCSTDKTLPHADVAAEGTLVLAWIPYLHSTALHSKHSTAQHSTWSEYLLQQRFTEELAERGW